MPRKRKRQREEGEGLLTEEERKRLEEKIGRMRQPGVEGTAITQGFMATSFTSVGGGPHTLEHAAQGHGVGYLVGEILPGKLELRPEKLTGRRTRRRRQPERE